MFDINEVLAKSDLLHYVEMAGGKLNGNNKRYASHCPLHGGDNPTALSIYLEDGRWKWKCFTGACGGGDAITFVEIWQGFTEKTDSLTNRRITIFEQACEFITGKKSSDPLAMKESAERRLETAKIEAEDARKREEARRLEFQKAERHLQYHKNLQSREWMRAKWLEWGIDDGMQDFWTLGGCDDFFVDGEYHSPTLTIPVFDEIRNLLTIRHRILNPKDPHDKYRPDRKGLCSHPFLAIPEMGFDGGLVWVMEGEKKAMVTWTRCDIEWQCIGVPGQEMYKSLIDKLKPIGQRVVVVPDPNSPRNPNATKKAFALAKEIGGRYLQLPSAIDDLILSINIGKNDLYQMQKQARKA